jgi:hypothetical protein
MEALVLKVLGGWETLKADVNWAYYHSAGPGGKSMKQRGLPAKINQVAKTYNVRWPHDNWSTTCNKADKLRQKFAHLLHVYKVDNDSPPPNRKLAFMRLGRPGRPRSVDGQPGELSFRDEVWSQQDRHIDAVIEQDLADALGAIKWQVDSVHFLRRLGDLLSGDQPWPDDYELPEWARARPTRLVVPRRLGRPQDRRGDSGPAARHAPWRKLNCHSTSVPYSRLASRRTSSVSPAGRSALLA